MPVNEIVECALTSGYVRTIVKVKVKKCQKSKSQNLKDTTTSLHPFSGFFPGQPG